MSRKNDLQYLADSLLIDKLAMIDIGLTKNAGLTDAVSSIAQSVLGEFKQRVESGGGGATGAFAALSDFFLMGFLPMRLKIIFGIFDSFGFNVGAVLKRVWNELEPKIKGGQSLSDNEVKNITQNAVREQGGEESSEDSSESNDMLYAFRKIESDGMLVRVARSGDFSGIGNAIANVFKTHGAPKGKWLSGGFLFYIIKTVLIGAGLLMAGSAVTKYLGVGNKKEQSDTAAYTGEAKPQAEQAEQNEQNEYSVKPLPWVPPVVPNSLTETGSGQTHFTNDGVNKIWSVPLKGDLKNTMILWAGYVYKELEGQGQLLNSTPAFNIMVSNLNNYIDRSYLSVPPNFHSLKEIVDTFAGQAARKLGKQKESEHEAA